VEPTRHVLFRAGGERFALPLASVREVVIPQPPFARVPRSSPGVRGAMNLRGRVVALVDLAALVGIGSESLEGGRGQVIIFDREPRSLGILVGQVLGVAALAPESLEPRGGMVTGVAQIGEAAVTLLDPEQVAQHAAAQFGTAH
jgi:purine-binding chemotaxis protein CheW